MTPISYLNRSILILAHLLPILSFASQPRLVRDDSIPIIKKKREAFLKTYGTNDTSRALIKYFNKREDKTKREMKRSIIIGGIAIIIFIAIIIAYSPIDIGLGFILFIIGSFGAGGILGALESFVKIIFLRKRLLKLLKRNEDGKGIPKAIASGRRFKKELKLEKL